MSKSKVQTWYSADGEQYIYDNPEDAINDVMNLSEDQTVYFSCEFKEYNPFDAKGILQDNVNDIHWNCGEDAANNFEDDCDKDTVQKLQALLDKFFEDNFRHKPLIACSKSTEIDFYRGIHEYHK